MGSQGFAIITGVVFSFGGTACPASTVGSAVLEVPTLAPSTEPPAAASAARICEVRKDIVRQCYDKGDPGVLCLSLRLAIVKQAAAEGASGAAQRVVGKLCDMGCQERQLGHAWLSVNDAIDCSKAQ